MLNYFIQKAHNRKMMVHPASSSVSPLRSLSGSGRHDSAYRAKASEVHLVEQAMVAAIGAGLPSLSLAKHGVDIGGNYRHRCHLARGIVIALRTDGR
jgi:rod shape-determining protein MreB